MSGAGLAGRILAQRPRHPKARQQDAPQESLPPVVSHVGSHQQPTHGIRGGTAWAFGIRVPRGLRPGPQPSESKRGVIASV